jgi:hypothetical protein
LGAASGFEPGGYLVEAVLAEAVEGLGAEINNLHAEGPYTKNKKNKGFVR